MFKDPMRDGCEIRVQIESLEGRKSGPKVERVADEVIKSLVQVPEDVSDPIDLSLRLLLPHEPHGELSGTHRDVMVHPFVKAERRLRITEVRPASFFLVRVRLEVALVRIRKLRDKAAVAETSHRVTYDKWRLQSRIEAA